MPRVEWALLCDLAYFDDGIYRFDVALASQPPISIDLPIVVVGQSTQAGVQSDRYRDQAAGAALPRRGMDHV